MSDKSRIIELQRQVKIATRALEAIAHGGRDPEFRASEALTEMIPLNRKQPLQGLLGHGRNAE